MTKLNPCPSEVIITADGCTDATVELIRGVFRDVTLIINELRRGSVVSRDRIVREAQSDLILALDDDSYPEQKDYIEHIRKLFAGKPALAVARFLQRSDEYPDTLQQNEFGLERLTNSFASSGAVLRRSIYLQLAGFEPRFFHMYENVRDARLTMSSPWMSNARQLSMEVKRS